MSGRERPAGLPATLVEQALQRLAQLERAGVHVPWAAAQRAQVPAPPHEPPETALAAARPAAAAPRRPRPPPATEVALDLQHLRAAGRLASDHARDGLMAQFRQVKRPLLQAVQAPMPGKDASPHAGHIMVTSALRGEGKTFCALNLAMSLALEVDTSVVLVDADVVRPGVFERLGLSARPPGLLDLLRGSVGQLAQALVGTDVAKLLLMAPGEHDPRATELLASGAMDRLLTRLAEEYADHVVIFDAPPLLNHVESTVLASKVGQVLVVVEAGKTPRAAVQQAFAALTGCPVVASVLNKSDEA